MPSVDVHLSFPELIERAIQQNSVELVLCDLLVVLRNMKHEPNADKWSQAQFINAIRIANPTQYEDMMYERDAVIEKLEDALTILDPSGSLITVSKRKA